MSDERRLRLQRELAEMRTLSEDSSIFDFESVGEAPEVYKFRFRGRLIARESGSAEVEDVDHHRCDVRLPYRFPQTPPDIRFTTAVFHPNISAGGFVDLSQLGLEWTDELTLAVVCERLWDACRLAVLQLDGCTNAAAAQWVRDNQVEDSKLGNDQLADGGRSLPLDERPLRNLGDRHCRNVVRYKRRGSGPSQLTTGHENRSEEILFIGDEPLTAPRTSPSPPSEERTTRSSGTHSDQVEASETGASADSVPSYRRRYSDGPLPSGEIFYIGDDDESEGR